MSGETVGVADIREILRLLPHRYPFVMIDRVIDIRGEEHGIGIKNVTFNEPQFLGHFPDNPVMPGVLVIEGMAQTAGVLCLRKCRTGERRHAVYFLTIDKAKFRKPAVPGDTHRISRQQDRAPPQHVVVPWPRPRSAAS
jgi:3-hydroxyacyl-[acyl-carrier-protein] dehydratase